MNCSSILHCHFNKVLDNPIFDEITFILTESLELVQGDGVSGPARGAGQSPALLMCATPYEVLLPFFSAHSLFSVRAEVDELKLVIMLGCLACTTKYTMHL